MKSSCAAPSPAHFPVVVNKRTVAIVVDKSEAEVVSIAADLLARGGERVSGVKPQVGNPGAVIDRVGLPAGASL